MRGYLCYIEVLDKMFLIVVLFESVAMNFRFEFPLFIGGRDVIGLSCREQLQIYYSRHALGQNCLLLFFIKYNDKHFPTQNETSNINFNFHCIKLDLTLTKSTLNMIILQNYF